MHRPRIPKTSEANHTLALQLFGGSNDAFVREVSFVDPATQTASITLSRYDLSIWDVVAQGWAKPSGTIAFSIGASSRDFRLSGTIPE